MLSSTGVVVWVTGLSAAGKTTFAYGLCESLRAAGVMPVLLDGDALRQLIGVSRAAYSREERLELAFRYAEICRYLADQGHVVVIATIALFREIHEWNRSQLPNYTEVFMDYPMSELQARDPKGLYERHRLGQVSSVAGLDFEVDFPDKPHWHVTTKFEGYPSIIQLLTAKILESHRES